MMITCGECGREVSDQSYICPCCGRDVRVLKSNGYGCGNCDEKWSCDKEWGPSGYPCLHYSEMDND